MLVVVDVVEVDDNCKVVIANVVGGSEELMLLSF